MARLTRAAEDGSLADLELAPDGRWQTRAVTLAGLTREVAAHLAATLGRHEPEDLPVFVVAWGKCRVGSTALTNLFGIAGVPAFYQPVKTTARHLLVGSQPPPWEPPSASEHPLIMAKEMAGPYLAVETVFNPLAMLVDAGYPAAKLHLLVLEREPLVSLSSWLHKWADRLPRRTLVEHFALSSLAAPRMEAWAGEYGVPVTHYLYEASRRPEQTIAALLARLGIGEKFRPEVVNDWDERGELGSERSLIFFPREPEVYVVPGLHSSFTRYAFQPRAASNLMAEERRLVEELGLEELYARSARAMCEELGFDEELARAVLAPG